MWKRLFITAAVVAALPFVEARADLTIGMQNVGWEGANFHNIDTGPYLFRDVPEADLISVRTKISTQSVGNWSQSGLLLRNPASASLDGLGANEDWLLNLSFRPAPSDNRHKAVNGLNGADADTDNTGLAAGSITFLRIDRVGAGQFRLYRGSGTDDNITWTQHSVGLVNNADLGNVPLQIGVTGGDYINNLVGATTVFDWVEIQTTGGTYFDDFSYNHNFAASGVPGFNDDTFTGGGIWNGVYNATLGGTNTTANFASCTVCTWNTDAGDWNAIGNWAGGISETPTGNTVTAIFGASLAVPVATVYTDVAVIAKELRFDNANKYVLAGAGQVTLDADSGNALINVQNGSHEIQVPLFLDDDVTASAPLGSTLNINSIVRLNGHEFNTSGAGTINLNNGTIAAGSGAGSGSAVNAANLVGLSSVEGNLTQTADGSLGVVVGAAPIQVLGAAVLDGVLDVSLADGFTPIAGQSYAVLTADSVTDAGLSLGGSAAGMFRLAISDGSVALTAVPEPAAFSLIFLASCVVAAARRWRCKSRG